MGLLTATCRRCGDEKPLSVKRKAAGRPYPNLIDNIAAARKKGK